MKFWKVLIVSRDMLFKAPYSPGRASVRVPPAAADYDAAGEQELAGHHDLAPPVAPYQIV